MRGLAAILCDSTNMLREVADSAVSRNVLVGHYLEVQELQQSVFVG